MHHYGAASADSPSPSRFMRPAAFEARRSAAQTRTAPFLGAVLVGGLSAHASSRLRRHRIYTETSRCHMILNSLEIRKKRHEET